MIRFADVVPDAKPKKATSPEADTAQAPQPASGPEKPKPAKASRKPRKSS